jgi:hypothetical protein
MNRGVPYRISQGRLYRGPDALIVPVYTVEDDGVEIELTVLSLRELRGTLKTSPEGKGIERAKLAAVEQLLSDT